MTYEFLQNYWWVLIALLGGLLVALMFVQGANLHLGNRVLSDTQKRMILNSTGRKWELTFTTLVTFGGAFFASFPLFYSTSFGGAYWVWILLLITFVFQAVAYEFQNKKGNLLGVKGFRLALIINGMLAPFLVGTAVGTFFTGSDFTVNKVAITDPSAPVISTWGNNWHGLEALGQYHAVLLGAALMLLAGILGALYILNNVDDETIHAQMRRTVKMSIGPFLFFFLCWLVILLVSQGYAVTPDQTVYLEPFKYWHNLLAMPVVLVMLLVGVVLVRTTEKASGETRACPRPISWVSMPTLPASRMWKRRPAPIISIPIRIRGLSPAGRLIWTGRTCLPQRKTSENSMPIPSPPTWKWRRKKERSGSISGRISAIHGTVPRTTPSPRPIPCLAASGPTGPAACCR